MGQPLTRENVAGQSGRVVVYVDQVRYAGDLRSIVLGEGTLVRIWDTWHSAIEPALACPSKPSRNRQPTRPGP